MNRNWRDINYLAQGTLRQRAAYQALQSTQVLAKLAAFDPVLAGTIPLNIDIAGSDLDIICYAPDLEQFARVIRLHFSDYPDFACQKTVLQLPTVVARFIATDFEFEIFGQPCPVEQQNAVRHLEIEARLLDIGGEGVRQKIRQLKQAGLKTEPAFAALFVLTGDPYETLLALETGL
ncbi:MAG: DUF4269 domain-containing protein [Spirulina sp. SIO3F2]|nr:DUF4269 domain-containing protein [Spirulina sp. SIO3F2]